MSKRLNLPRALGIFIVGISLGSISNGLAQTSYSEYTWNNSTNNWTTSTAWSPNWSTQYTGSTNGLGQTNSDVAIFTAGTGNTDVLLTQNRTVWGIKFTTNASGNATGYTISSSGANARALDIFAGTTPLPGGLVNSSGTNQVFNLLVRNANGNGTWSNTLGSTTTFNGGLNLNTDSSSTTRTLTLAGAGNVNVASTIANGATNIGAANRVTITSTGTTTFSGNNTYDGLTTMNAAGGTLTLSGDNSGAAGGVTLTAGTLNINNNNALGSGALSLAGAGARINNTSGSAVVSAGNQAWALADGLAFGSATNTAANDLNLGNGVVTVAGSRTIALEGTGTKLTIGAANITSTSSGRTITANGVGNTLEMGGLTLSGNTTAAVTVTLAGTANLGITGAIVNGQAFANGVTITNTGTTTFSGNNTYTGSTTIFAGTTILSGNNSAATGSLVLGGASGTLDKPLVKLNSVNAISSSSTISGSSSSDRVGTLDFNAGTAYTLNSYTGGSMNFTNSFGQDSVVTFTNAASTLTSSTGITGGRSLQNNSANLDIVFNGSLDIGSSTTDTVNTIGGAGDFVVKGNIFSTTAGSVRGLSKTGSGLLEMRGANNSYNGDTLIWNGTLSVTNGALLTGSTVKLNAGTLNVGGTVGAVVQTNGTYNLRGTGGDLTLSGGAATVFSGGTLGNTTVTNTGSLLVVNGTAGAVTVNNGGSLGGSGTNGVVTLNSGSLLNPGNSPGTLTANSATVLGGSTYNWEISALTGTAGTNWDLLSVTTLLDMSDITGTGTDKWNLVVTGNGAFTGWTDNRSYEYIFAQAADLILASNFSTDFGTDVTSLFNITTSGISSNPNGDFKVVVGSANGLTTLNLVAVAVPEPSTGSLMFFGLGGLLLNRLIRRKVS